MKKAVKFVVFGVLLSPHDERRRAPFGIRRLPCAPLVRILPYMFEKNWKEA